MKSLLLFIALANVAGVIGWLAAARHHRVGPYAETGFAPRDPEVRRAAREQPARGVWL